MTTIHETGHAKNVANFETLISFVGALGAIYNPSQTNLQLASLQAKVADAAATISSLNATLPLWSNAIATRATAFDPLPKLSTRLISALKATQVNKNVIANFATLHRKLQGRRASAKLNEEELAALAATGKVVTQISASQTSFDMVLDTLNKMVYLLESIPQYAPNEVELTVATLKAECLALKKCNDDVKASATTLANTRIKRNREMYDPETGLVITALNVKNYLKSLVGISSPEYKQISGLPFTYVKL